MLNLNYMLMKKILLFFGMLLLSVFGFTQTSVIIIGETNPNANQTYTYRINQFIGVSGTNATWKVTNGKFLNGSTTLTQDVDNTSVDVIWTKAGGSGTLSYSYQNGSSAGYAGTTSVSIKGDGSTGGGSTGGYTWDLDNYGVTEMSPGETQMFSCHISNSNPNLVLTPEWIYDTTCFEKVVNTADNRSITLRAKGTMERRSTDIVVKLGGNIKLINMAIRPIYLSIINSDGYICNNQTTTQFSIKNIENLSGTFSVLWQSTPTLTPVSGQGTAAAIYQVGATSGLNTIKATISYKGIDYIYEGQVWVGPPAKPLIEGLAIGDYKPNTDYLLVSEYKYTDSFNWRVVGGATLLPGIDGVYSQRILRTDNLSPNKTTSFSVYLTAQNRCGTSPQRIENGYVVAGGFPDPGEVGRAGDPKFELQSATAIAPVTIKVYTFNTGTLVYSEKNVIDFNIQNTTLKEGIYVVVTTDQNGETKSEKVVKTRN